ncbi:unnamed protein product [Albugo candida]|uniref:Uncharacterized protein n=1 Tax=Albugo candida TaxID=65357 RepID=A0A024G0I3_9STRA|nr:unnamed protein product [Albugo candida]|eukprot:CCI40063.1 unnamed protein product [Albugo candida]
MTLQAECIPETLRHNVKHRRKKKLWLSLLIKSTICSLITMIQIRSYNTVFNSARDLEACNLFLQLHNQRNSMCLVKDTIFNYKAQSWARESEFNALNVN